MRLIELSAQGPSPVAELFNRYLNGNLSASIGRYSLKDALTLTYRYLLNSSATRVINSCVNLFTLPSYFSSWNSTLPVERRKWGNADEREVRRTRSKVIASCRAREWKPEAEGLGSLPREITLSRDHLWSSVANFTQVCMTAFASRCVYYFTRWGHGNWRLEWRSRGFAGAEPPDCHDTNLKCFMNKFCHATCFFILSLDEHFPVNTFYCDDITWRLHVM